MTSQRSSGRRPALSGVAFASAVAAPAASAMPADPVRMPAAQNVSGGPASHAAPVADSPSAGGFDVVSAGLGAAGGGLLVSPRRRRAGPAAPRDAAAPSRGRVMTLSRKENSVFTTIRPLTFAVGLLASLLLALPTPAQAADHRLTGTAFVNPSPGTPCPVPPSDYDDFPPS